MQEQNARLPLDTYEAPFAFHSGEPVDVRRFCSDTSGLRDRLEDRPENRWGLYCEDSYYFAISLFALLLSGKTTVILPNFQPEYVDSISSGFDALLTDHSEPAGRMAYLHPKAGRCAANAEVQPIALDKIEGKVSLFTSGSTGEPKLVEKEFRQLKQEIYELDSLWGKHVGNAVIFSTVSHQHIYGLLFKILWPTLTGRCFDSKTYQYPELLVKEIAGFPKTVLISSPAHLKRIPYMVDLEEVKHHIVAIFSSGGPLPNNVAMDISRALDIDTIEIFGSTETGGVAYRSQTQPGAVPWTPLPSVKLKSHADDKRLLIHSPYEGSGQWYKMGDIVELLPDFRFLTLGRADRIVKVEEKRLSLTELEGKLRESTLVGEATATVLNKHRHCVAVAVVLSTEGVGFLQQHGRKAICEQLRSHLKRYFEAVVLPKKWRFVERLPANSQGKITQAAIEGLFSGTNSEETGYTHPVVQSYLQEDDNLRLELHIPVNLLYFDGHFPDQPIVPGVVQIFWAWHFGKQYLGIAEHFQALEVLKFHKFIEPGDTIALNLNYNASKHKLYFSYESAQGIHSSGRLTAGKA